ncbi:hypothetical protein ATI53_1001225 [Salipiger aestuarii]|uniref:Uncharacterized protein n=2 Tax=Salipiger aestuarii TaxID=568098 RepID=A0A327YSQ0_9RHOB|nr:hypothetical protein ATI53_1001225 [Salipiger aestuarii]
MMLAAMILLAGIAWAERRKITESRAWRDVRGLTPFHNVTVDRAEVQGSDLRVWGGLEKRRCEKIGHVAYTSAAGGQRFVAGFRSEEPKETPDDRPPVAGPQAFGPWVFTALYGAPDHVSFWALHRCPEGIQYNLVFRIPWADRRP